LVTGALSIPEGRCVAKHKKSIYSLRRSVENSMLTWSYRMIKTPIAIAATAAVGLPFAQLTPGQSVWGATSMHCTG
jgi:hypothetical protein